MSAASGAATAGVMALAGCSGYAMARAALARARGLAARDRLAGPAGEAGALSLPLRLALEVARAAGTGQERLPGVRRLSSRLHAFAGRWFRGRDPGREAWLVLHEALALAVFAGLTWLLADPLIGALLAAASCAVPSLLLRDRHERLQRRIRAELPDVLDLLAMAFDAGAGLDAGLQQVADHLGGGVLPDAIRRMLARVRHGARRHDSWREMAGRLGSAEVGEVAEALVQADRMGVGLSGTLAELSARMRVRRRQRAEEEAHKAPVKLLFPLALFIFPTMFIVLVGPVALQLLAILG